MTRSSVLNRMLVLVVACGVSLASRAQTVINAGWGSYYADTPSSFERPVNSSGTAVTPRITGNYSGPPQTNEWWSSLIWQRSSSNAYGSQMYPLPLAVKAQPDGLDIGYVSTPSVFGTGYNFPLGTGQTAMRIGVAGMTSATVLVDSAGDWSVAPIWSGNGRTLKLWLARGSPFVYADCSGGGAEVRFNAAAGTATVWSNSGNVLGVTIAGSSYGLFAPAGATWTVSNGVASSTLAGKGYFSVAALPSQSSALLTTFAARAFAFVTDTRVSWSLDTATSKVNVTHQFITTAREGANTTPLVTMFRHLWLRSPTPTLGVSYTTARGEAKLAAAGTITSSFDFGGVVPFFPSTGGISSSRLWSLVDQVYQQSNLNTATDSYFSGKAYGRIAQLIPLAEQAGHTAARDRFIGFLRDELSDWLTVGQSAQGGIDAYVPIQAEAFSEQSGGLTIGPSPTGQAVLGFTGGSWVKFPNVNFKSGKPGRFLVRYASGTTGSGLLEAVADGLNGTVIAGGGVGRTGGVNTWTEVPLALTSAGAAMTGLHDVYLRVTTPYEGELLRIDSFRFERSGSTAVDRAFAYNQAWDTLIASPASFGLGSEMNDHHFHYGYFIMAAATLARYDPTWAANYGPMVDLLIRDAANYDRADTRFPMLRNFDPYAGHSYASGHQAFFAGNNQESSSEAMNFATGCFLWGAARGDNAVRDLGAMLYGVESDAIEQYWFDADNAVYPAAVSRKMAGLVWCYGAEYATWFTGNPWQIHGINFLPITPGSTYLGRRPDMLSKNWSILQASAVGQTPAWLDINYSMLAMTDATTAQAWLDANPNFTSEEGESAAHTEHWIRTMRRVGQVDTTVTADMPTYAAFRRGDERHRFVWNPGASNRVVRFSDGRSMTVPAGQVVYWRNLVKTITPGPGPMTPK
ncbi:MAG: glycosyl hydrolase [Planctomycetota bacterium]|nr:glycosyl hydrolase [Planctomycetota bacterium]